jgi:hypothetical protein
MGVHAARVEHRCRETALPVPGRRLKGMTIDQAAGSAATAPAIGTASRHSRPSARCRGATAPGGGRRLAMPFPRPELSRLRDHAPSTHRACSATTRYKGTQPGVERFNTPLAAPAARRPGGPAARRSRPCLTRTCSTEVPCPSCDASIHRGAPACRRTAEAGDCNARLPLKHRRPADGVLALPPANPMHAAVSNAAPRSIACALLPRGSHGSLGLRFASPMG